MNSLKEPLNSIIKDSLKIYINQKNYTIYHNKIFLNSNKKINLIKFNKIILLLIRIKITAKIISIIITNQLFKFSQFKFRTIIVSIKQKLNIQIMKIVIFNIIIRAIL